MARYANFKYGQETYGITSHSNLLWALQIDWDGDGVYTGVNETRWLTNIQTRRGRQYLLSADGKGFQPIEIGEVTFEMDNDDLRYDPYNVNSSIYPYVRPGVDLKLSVKIGSTGTLLPVFTGRIADIQPISGSYPKRVTITAVDGLQRLRDQTATVSLKETIAVDDALNFILDSVDWPSSWGRELDSSSDILKFWWVNQKAARQAIIELTNAYIGTFFIAADGKAKFYGRSHSSLIEKTITQNEINKEIKKQQPWEVIRNVVTCVSNPRVEQSSTDLWKLWDAPLVEAGESIEIWATFSYNGQRVPAKNLISPAAATDYTMNSNSSGTGTNLTANFSITMTAFAESAKLVITNNGATNGYITLLKLRGQAITSPDPIQIIKEDSNSISLFGPRQFTLNSTWLQDTNIAIDLANYISINFAVPQMFLTIRMEHHPDNQFEVDLFDIIQLTIESENIDALFQIAYIEHKWLDENGQTVETIMKLEPASVLSAGQWEFPTQIGISSRFAF
jgi:hypothetical protein